MEVVKRTMVLSRATKCIMVVRNVMRRQQSAFQMSVRNMMRAPTVALSTQMSVRNVTRAPTVGLSKKMSARNVIRAPTVGRSKKMSVLNVILERPSLR